MRKTIVTTITIGVAGAPAEDGSLSTLYAPPGSEVTLAADEADRILARFGGEVLAELPDEQPAAKS